jgi:nucleoside-diphosphate-sugar epimerase
VAEEESDVRRVGVTGAAGFIGSHLCDRLLREEFEVVGVDDLSRGTLTNLSGCLDQPNYQLEIMDCTNRRRLRQVFDSCDAIVHLAAQKIPRYGGALKTLDSNVAGVKAAAGVALALDADLIVASTSDVYGNAVQPFNEDGELVLGPPTSRRWAYAVSKLFDEHVCLALAEERGLKVTILRFFGSYGPRNHPSWWGGPQAAFFEALLNGQQMEIHGDGLQTRTFTFVGDTVDGIFRALITDEARGEIVNVGGAEPTTILALAQLVQSRLGLPQPLRAKFVPYTSLPGNYQDVRHRVPDTTKARRLLGFEARTPLERGLARTAEWHRQLRGDQASVYG